jgi:hypothetical protein
MTYIYYIDGEKFISDEIPWDDISSPNEQTPALENLITGVKEWHIKKYIFHRLTGPAHMLSDGRKFFYLNGKRYENIKEWIKDHPNPDLYFDAIGVITETDKVLWFLKN